MSFGCFGNEEARMIAEWRKLSVEIILDNAKYHHAKLHEG
jgi:hypothetical protein